MNGARQTSACASARLSIVAAGILLAWMPRSGGASGLFNLELLERHRVDVEPVQRAVEAALPRLTRGTNLAKRWSVNPSNAGLGDLRVILFRSDATTNANEVTETYTNGCVTS